ncbi:MAG: phosphodiesterase [Propionicimonas sp.]
MSLPPTVALGQYPPPDQVIVHLSDTHFVAGGAPLMGAVDSDGRLAEALRGLSASGLRPSAIVVTGDIADTGAADAYLRVRTMLEPVAEELGAQLIWVMGNHDDRAAFRAGLLDVEPSGAEVDAVHDLDGLRLIVLDSTVPGHHWGLVTPAQLEWLAEVLATPAPRGSILAMHHPPLPIPVVLAQLIELREQSTLEAVLAGSDIRAIIAGHLHYSTWSTFAGIPVSAAAATCYTTDLLAPTPGLRGQDGGQAFNLIHVYPGQVVHSIVPIGDYPTAFEIPVSHEQLAMLARLSPEEQEAIAFANDPGNS